MGKIITCMVSLVLVWNCYIGQAFAKESLDLPSRDYTDKDQATISQLSSTATYYVRAFSCNGRSSWTKELHSESTGFTWIVGQGWKGYIQAGSSGGRTIGVVLNNTKIDFDYPYLAKKGFAGNNRTYVKGIQSALRCLGYEPGAIDGIFGTKTEAAVKAFQHRKGLTVDGVVGKQTYHYLSFATG
ncbi:peptidoglycan-binding domain-containing protein [Metabacillus sp. Hm71]|uniref:peptidoglycan-binding domain-containing protein n=1 Tax=Metabacillus sp. Hm71 TaxID=3450743 RepID=UPI003F4329BB